MMNIGRIQQRWVLAPSPDRTRVTALAQATGVPYAIASILLNRGLEEAGQVDAFLQPSLTALKDPFTMKGMDMAVERVVAALMSNEKVMIYGDYDVDGITATTLLYLSLNRLGAQVVYYLPNRLVEGYGLSVEGIDEAKKQNVRLIVTVDTGITAVEEVAYAKSLGIEVVITDHHEPGSVVPEAYAIVNPKQPGCTYGGELAGVGVAFKFAQALFKRLNQDDRDLMEHLDLVALGTSADIVPLVGENRLLTYFGLRQISRTAKPGLKSLANISGLLGKDISTGHAVFILAPRISALGRLGDATAAIRLLSTRDETVANGIARTLESENKRRKEIDEHTLREALAQIDEMVDLVNDRAIVLSGEGWHQGVIGIVASRLVERYHLPTVMIAITDGEAKGSARSIPGFHLCEALKECESLLERYGGHKYAAGLSIKPENIPAFREKFMAVSLQTLSADDIIPKLHIDAEVELNSINDTFMTHMESFSPFGPQNMRPVFMTRNVEILGEPNIVGSNHLRLRLRKGDAVFDAIGFGLGELKRAIPVNGALIDLVYTIEYNTYNDITRIQIRLRDLRPSGVGI